MADETIWTPVLSLPQAMRLAARNMRPSPPSVVLRWPNALGETPTDALGKQVRLSNDGKDTDFRVDGVEGERLILKEVG